MKAPCAGLGVTLTKSAKLKLVPGVCGPKVSRLAPLVPGVMCDEGSGVDLHGGVDGGGGSGVLAVRWSAADGELAR